MPTFSSRLLLAAFALLTGCRSQQLAFDFQPPTPAPTVVSTAPITAAPQPAEIEVAVVPPVAARGATAAHRLALTNRRRVLPTPTIRPVHSEIAVHQGSHRAQYQQLLAGDEPEHRSLHIILGSLLIVGGVVGGILLGGWLGLGVGATIVLGGYYFLGLAFGGKHGWREVFQEFFNM